MSSTFNFKNVAKTVLITTLALPLVVGCTEESLNAQDIEAEDIFTTDERLSEFIGQPITLYGQFQGYIGGTLFLMEGEDPDELEDVLVVNQSRASFSVPTGEETPIWAIGQVQPLSLDEIDGLDVDGLDALDGQPALYADRITLAPEPDDLTADEESFYEQELTIFGVVEQIEPPETFILEEPGLFETGGVIVIQTGDAADTVAVDGDRVAISGTLRPFILSELEQEYELTWNLELKEQLEAEFREAPVFIADTFSAVEE